MQPGERSGPHRRRDRLLSSPMLDDPALAVLHRAADAVGRGAARRDRLGPDRRRATASTSPTSPPTRSPLSVLVDAGFAVLSEESGCNRHRRAASSSSIRSTARPTPAAASRGSPRRCAWSTSDGPAVALVVNQASGERIAAARGQGAWIGERRLVSSGCRDLRQALVGVSGRPDVGVGMGAVPRARAPPRSTCASSPGDRSTAYVDMSVDAHGVWDYLAGALCARRPAVRSSTPSAASSPCSTTTPAAPRSPRPHPSCSTRSSPAAERSPLGPTGSIGYPTRDTSGV